MSMFKKALNFLFISFLVAQPFSGSTIYQHLSKQLSTFAYVQMCFEWFTKGQHDLESDVQQQLFKEKILKLEPYEITMNGGRNFFLFRGACLVFKWS